MLIELHTHTAEHSPCSSISAAELVMMVYSKEASGIVFTDHHYLWPDDEISELRSRLDIPNDFLIMSGQEVFTKDFGDVLVYGASESIKESIYLAALRNRFPESALVWAHPYRNQMNQPNEIELFDVNFDAIEVLNPRQNAHGNERGLSDWKDWGFVATSGTDIHSFEFQQLYVTHFNQNITDIKGLIAGIKDGMCSPFHQKIVHGSRDRI